MPPQAAANNALITSIPHNTYTSQVGRGNAILANKNQQGNPLLKQLKNINYRFADIIPDYQFNDKVCRLWMVPALAGALSDGCVVVCAMLQM